MLFRQENESLSQEDLLIFPKEMLISQADEPGRPAANKPWLVRTVLVLPVRRFTKVYCPLLVYPHQSEGNGWDCDQQKWLLFLNNRSPQSVLPTQQIPKILQKSNKNSRKRLFCSFWAIIRKKQAKIIVVSTALSGDDTPTNHNVRHLKGHWKRQLFSFMKFFIYGMKPCHVRSSGLCVCLCQMAGHKTESIGCFRIDPEKNNRYPKGNVLQALQSSTSITGKGRLGNLNFSQKSRNKPIHNNRLIESTARFFGRKHGSGSSMGLCEKNAGKRNQQRQTQEKTIWQKEDSWKLKKDEWELRFFFQGERKDVI